MKFAFRSMSMGAPEWFIDAPNGRNGGGPWTAEEKAAVKAAVATYKAKIRPLVRNADLYHILPRPDGKNWDGIQYYDPAAKKGVVYLFKPAAGTDTKTIKLRGLEPKTIYRVSFEDGTNRPCKKTGEELLQGLAVTLKGAPVSELVFLEEAGAGGERRSGPWVDRSAAGIVDRLETVAKLKSRPPQVLMPGDLFSPDADLRSLRERLGATPAGEEKWAAPAPRRAAPSPRQPRFCDRWRRPSS